MLLQLRIDGFENCGCKPAAVPCEVHIYWMLKNLAVPTLLVLVLREPRRSLTAESDGTSAIETDGNLTAVTQRRVYIALWPKLDARQRRAAEIRARQEYNLQGAAVQPAS